MLSIRRKFPFTHRSRKSVMIRVLGGTPYHINILYLGRRGGGANPLAPTALRRVPGGSTPGGSALRLLATRSRARSAAPRALGFRGSAGLGPGRSGSVAARVAAILPSDRRLAGRARSGFGAAAGRLAGSLRRGGRLGTGRRPGGQSVLRTRLRTVPGEQPRHGRGALHRLLRGRAPWRPDAGWEVRNAALSPSGRS